MRKKLATRSVLLPCGEVWRAPGPPAPPTIVSSWKFEFPPHLGRVLQTVFPIFACNRLAKDKNKGYTYI